MGCGGAVWGGSWRGGGAGAKDQGQGQGRGQLEGKDLGGKGSRQRRVGGGDKGVGA